MLQWKQHSDCSGRWASWCLETWAFLPKVKGQEGQGKTLNLGSFGKWDLDLLLEQWTPGLAACVLVPGPGVVVAGL